MPREPFERIRSALEKPLQRRGLFRPPHLPRFLGIGAQKSGTTWLHAQLACHPDLFLPAEKELHYFDWNFHRPLGWYANAFSEAGERLPGEITPGYAILDPERIEFVASVLPGLRVIYLMRDPIERAWSQVVMNSIELDGEDPTTIDVDTWIDRLSEPRVIRRSDHLAVVDAWSRWIPSDRMLLGFFEEIANSPQDLLGRVHDFLGVASHPGTGVDGVVRRGVGTPMPPEVKEVLVERYTPDLRRLAERFGGVCEGWLERWNP